MRAGTLTEEDSDMVFWLMMRLVKDGLAYPPPMVRRDGGLRETVEGVLWATSGGL